jgi:predicted small lipoprotein YifL
MNAVFRAAALAVLFLLLLGACGQKGPLFLPSEDPGKSTEPDQESP